MWQRVPAPSAGTVRDGALAVVSALAAILAPVAAVAAYVSGDLRAGTGLAVAGVFLGGWCVAAYRLARKGVFISPAGVRVRRVMDTTTVPWQDVVSVESRPGHAFGVPVRRDAIWIVRTTGADVETPLQRRAGRWPGGSFDAELTLLTPAAYDRALTMLRHPPRPTGTR